MIEILRERCGLDVAGGPVLVGVSGGADSLSLLHVLHAAGYPLVCATFNHCLRPESGDEVEHVRRIAAGLGIRFETDSEDVAAYAAVEGLSIEEAARTLRYRFLFRAARQVGAQAVAVGHTADDQAETVLMHFLRGAGLSGLRGMSLRSILAVFDSVIPLVRPLLGWWRADTERYCRENKLSPIQDASNADTTYFRNRLRHELIPQLESYNPRFREAIVRTALAVQGDADLLAETVDAAWQKSVFDQGAGFVAFERAKLETFSPALRRNLFRRAAFSLKPGLRDVDFDALERAARLRDTEMAGGIRTLSETSVVYVLEDGAALPVSYPQLDQEISIMRGQNDLKNGWFLICEDLETVEWSWGTDGWLAFMDADLLGEQLQVRPLRPGDRFEPLGMPGQSMKLSDFFVNRRIPKRMRKNWLLFCAGDKIAWVAGLRLAHPFRVTENTRRVVKLTLVRRT